MNWLDKDNPQRDVIISTRMRVGRNLKNYSFTKQLNEEDYKDIINHFKDQLKDHKDFGPLLDIDSLTSVEKGLLRERQIIDETIALNPHLHFSFMPDFDGAIHINNVDHFRLLYFRAGMPKDELIQTFKNIQDLWNHDNQWAFDAELGYLSPNIYQSGTNMKVSTLLHLPGLCVRKDFEHLLMRLEDQGLQVRGFYSDSDDGRQELFQISNRYTLGASEIDTIQAIERVSQDLRNLEIIERQKLYQRNRAAIEDRIFRSLGICQQARIMEKYEAEGHIMNLRLGSTLKLIDCDLKKCDRILYFIQDSHLAYEEEGPNEVDFQKNLSKRAELLRMATKEIRTL